MSCGICGRHQHPQRLPFLCPVDARNQLYEPRIAHAVALLQNEKLEEQVNSELGAAAAEADGGGALSARVQLETWENERQEIVERANDATARARKLRGEMSAARKEIDRRKDLLRQRRSDLAAASNGTAARRARLQIDVERSIAMTKFKWNQSYEATAATRGFLCMEASKLYGLRRVKKGSAIRYEIGGFEIVDPYNMNNLPPEMISTSLAHITHILMLACHYLSIRLPAEVTLPHRDYPRPTIFSLSSSYSHGEVPFPGTADLHPSLASASQDRDLFQRVPRARPLFVDKSLPSLAKDDSSAHTMFLEGIALLAYNIAWACSSQGVSIGEKASFDDVFSMGRNLYNLLIGNQLLNNPAGRIFSSPAAMSPSPGSPSRGSGAGNGSPHNPSSIAGNSGNGNSNSAVAASMGWYSHGTTHTFLNDDIVLGFKFPSPSRLADRLKTKLSSDSTMPDWEVLEDDAWAVEDEDQQNMEDGVLNRVVIAPPARPGVVGSARPSGRGAGGAGGNSTGIVVGSRVPEKRLYGVESVATVITSLEDTLAGMDLESQRSPPANGRISDRRPKGSGTSGWTKLRNR